MSELPKPIDEGVLGGIQNHERYVIRKPANALRHYLGLPETDMDEIELGRMWDRSKIKSGQQ